MPSRPKCSDLTHRVAAPALPRSPANAVPEPVNAVGRANAVIIAAPHWQFE